MKNYKAFRCIQKKRHSAWKIFLESPHCPDSPRLTVYDRATRRRTIRYYYCRHQNAELVNMKPFHSVTLYLFDVNDH